MTDHIKVGNVMPRIQFVGNGIAMQFVYPFAIFAKENLEVYLNDVKQAAGFSVSGVGSSAGGAVTFTAAPGMGVIVTLRRSLAIQRTTDFQESGDFRAATLNDELDYQTAALQNLAADLATAVRAAPTDEAASLILPKKAERAGKILGFDHNGGVEAKAPPVGGTNVHSQLQGLQSDDHPQYLTGARADAWLDSRTTDSLAEGVTHKYMRLAGTGTNTTAARTDHHHAGAYEPAFPKNTAFNKNFGTGGNEVAAGNHTHAFDLNMFALGDLGNVTEANRAEGYTLTWSAAAAQWQPRPQTGGGGSSLCFGLRNLITNAAFRINQRCNFATTLAAGVYGYDRWRAGASGCTYSVSGDTATITAGSLVQVIEGVNIPETGSYTLAWEGTATATVVGNTCTSGGTVTLTAGTNVSVAFTGGTVGKPQLEFGWATPYEHRPYAMELLLCERHYQKSYAIDAAPGSLTLNGAVMGFAYNTANLAQISAAFSVRMCTSPTMVIYSTITGAANHVHGHGSGDHVVVAIPVEQTCFRVDTTGLTPGEYVSYQWTADAEL